MQTTSIGGSRYMLLIKHDDSQFRFDLAVCVDKPKPYEEAMMSPNKNEWKTAMN